VLDDGVEVEPPVSVELQELRNETPREHYDGYTIPRWRARAAQVAGAIEL